MTKLGGWGKKVLVAVRTYRRSFDCVSRARATHFAQDDKVGRVGEKDKCAAEAFVPHRPEYAALAEAGGEDEVLRDDGLFED